jgi:pimeloyl-ACP methyl ester carboxylesterase
MSNQDLSGANSTTRNADLSQPPSSVESGAPLAWDPQVLEELGIDPQDIAVFRAKAEAADKAVAVEPDQAFVGAIAPPVPPPVSNPNPDAKLDADPDAKLDAGITEREIAHSASLSAPGEVRAFEFSWMGQSLNISYEVLGQGVPILLLPALSSISTREEMRPLAEILARRYQVYLLDWVGFGDSDRPAVDYQPRLYESLLRRFVEATFDQPVIVIAAGHAAGYVMELAQEKPGPWSWVVLVSPTWRGPLPTMMGQHKQKWFNLLRQLIKLPVVGPFLYGLNTTSACLGWMMRRHVYGDRTKVTRALILQKRRVTRAANARFASAAFVTGALDRVHSQNEWIDWFQPLPVPTLVVIGEQTPPKSRAEMEVIAHFCGVQVCRLPGSLALHEEYPEYLVAGILPFLDKYVAKARPAT